MSDKTGASIAPNRGRGDTYANGEPIPWPTCDLCGGIVPAVSSEPGLIRFRCPNDGWEWSSVSCRHSDRYCAYWMLRPIKGLD